MMEGRQQVRCKDASGWDGWDTIEVGRIYTIKSETTHHGRPALHLEEVVSVSGWPYYASRFEPVVDRERIISRFTNLVAQRALEDA